MRTIWNINSDWMFTKENAGVPAQLPLDWEPVELPHTWNAKDGQDGGANYFKGACWYAKELPMPEKAENDRVFLEINAAANAATVYVNGEKVTYHEGGYSTFRVDITNQLKEEENLLAICVDNSDKSNIYPQMADFTFYGGLYRDVNLIVVPEAHFDLEFYGAPGLTVTPRVIDGGAMLDLNAWVKNADENYTIVYTIEDMAAQIVAEAVRPCDKAAVKLALPGAHLWNGVKDPYLYTCTAKLVRRNEVVDEVSTRFGVRSFHVDSQKGFYLNGVLTPLRGVSRHQDKLGVGNALEAWEHWEDVEYICEIGANTVRLAHYQHNQEFYDACDEAGLIVWAEIPFISVMNEDPAAHENCRSQMKELIYQNYNHPSICFWGIANEITIGGMKEGLLDNLKDLNQLVHQLDPTRQSTIAQVSMVPMDSPMNEITDVVSYNHYFGWYGGKLTGNEEWLDKFHAMHPNIPIGISEYGAEGIITYHGDSPVVKDYSEGYQALYHEHMAKIIAERPWLWATHVWNMFDFGCDGRDEGGVAGRNNKGLMTFDRKIRKEAFYLYKAYWSEEPFVYVCGRRYAQRAGEKTTVKVYTNQPSVALYLDGQRFEVKNADKVVVFENVPLNEGFTTVVAKAGEWMDSITLERVEKLPDIYTLPREEDDGEGVANWFDTADTIDVPQEMTFDPAYYSIKDPIKEIAKCEEAMTLLTQVIGGAANIKLNPGMMNMVGELNLETMAGMLQNDKVPENAMQIVNAALQKIKKPE